MKIGVISDTHIPERSNELPQEILESFKKVDMVIHAGDIGDLSVLDKLKNVCPDVRAVYGNMDSDTIRKKVPEKMIIAAGTHRIGLMHGIGHPAKLPELMQSLFKNDNVDIVIFGHSHAPYNEKRGNTLYFNPGSPTDKIFSPYNSYGLIEINDTIEAKIVKLK